MSASAREAWRRDMGEASILPPDDPRRAEMQTEVARLGPWAEREWLALLAEGERWRLELGRVDVPDSLEDRLLRIPDECAARHARRSRVLRRVVGVAAAFLVAVAAWAVLAPRTGTDALQSLATLALNDHLDAHPVEVATADPAALAEGLRERVPFAVRLPRMPDDLRLAGGRRCTLGSHAVAFTSWGGARGRVTLLQLRRVEFDLPADLAPTIVTPNAAAARARPLDVLLWTEGEFGYVVVADDPGELHNIAARRR